MILNNMSSITCPQQCAEFGAAAEPALAAAVSLEVLLFSLSLLLVSTHTTDDTRIDTGSFWARRLESVEQPQGVHFDSESGDASL